MTATVLFSLVSTAVLLVLLRPLLYRYGLVDVPNARSSHTTPVVRGGGLAIAVGTSSALVVAGAIDHRTAVVFLAVSTGFAVLGFADDRRSRSVRLRLSIQVVLSAAAAMTLAADFELDFVLLIVATLCILVWNVAYVNLFNFMDGINGITAATAAIVGATNIAVGMQVDSDLVAFGGAALLGGAIGFFPFNFPTGRVFAGDVGSYFLGSYIAMLSVISLSAGASLVTVVAPLLLYLFDTTFTLARRARNGKSIWVPHREHTYQNLANNRLTHGLTTLLVAVTTGVCALVGLVAQGRSLVIAVLCLLIATVLAAGFVGLPWLLTGHRSVARTAP